MRLFLLSWLFPLYLFAQTDTTERNQELNEVVISVNKFEQLKREQPNQIQQITNKQISFQNTPNTADLLMNSGNVFVQKSQAGGGSPVLRGFESSRVLLVIDGVRMNNAIYRAGHLQNVLRIDQSMLQSAEVLFGPSSVIYGSDALGGVIHFRSRNPEFSTTKANAYVRYASAIGERTGHFDVNLGAKRFASITSITYGSFGDVIQGNNRLEKYPDFGKRLFYAERIEGKDTKVTNADFNKQIGTAYNQVDFLQKFSFKQSEKALHTLNFQFSNTSDVPRYDRLTEVANNLPRFAEWYYGPEKRMMFAYHLGLKNTRIYDNAQVTAAYQDIEESRISRRFNNLNKKSQFENVKVLTFNADFQKGLGKNLLQYGLEMTNNDVKSTATNLNISTNVVSKADTRYPDGKNTMSSFAVYLTDQLKISNKLILNGGLRFNSVKLSAQFIDKTFFPFPYNEAKQNPSALSGNVGVVYLPSKNTKISGLFSNGFRVPNIDDLVKVFESTAGRLIVPNPNIKPEKTNNYEASIQQKIGSFLIIEGTYFFTQFKNAIVVAPFTLNGESTVTYLGTKSNVVAAQNVREAKINGWNVAIRANLMKNLTLNSSLNNTVGVIQDDKKTPLDHIPPMFGRTGIAYKIEKLQIELFSLYNGWKHIEDYNPDGEDNQQYATADGMPSWWTLNFRSSYTLSKNLKIQAACENILDKNYRNFASGVSAAGRNFVITLRGSF